MTTLTVSSKVAIIAAQRIDSVLLLHAAEPTERGEALPLRSNEDEETFLTRFNVGGSSPTRLQRGTQPAAGERSFQLVCASVFAVSFGVVLTPLLVRKASKLRGIATTMSFADDDAENDPVLYLAERDARGADQVIRREPVGCNEASQSTLPGPRRPRHHAANVSETIVPPAKVSDLQNDRKVVTHYTTRNKSPSISSRSNTGDVPLAGTSRTSTATRGVSSEENGNVGRPRRRGKEKNATEWTTPSISFAPDCPVIRGRNFAADSRLVTTGNRVVAVLNIPRSSEVSLAERRFQFFFVTSRQHSYRPPPPAPVWSGERIK
ncbi:hypothetical protein HPB51_023033 [Rhipicephalus microplus]|uniref:Uncharacterized protein n=1 Tax=Rhipicephalus microplus TaxID=6941 RepID=A0A9J6D7B9_RHIMP|nr:hypothetical protein HPB51_023033 [Rhipicephalus microplus]